MPGEAGSTRYSLREPFERAIESVCKSLSSHGLRVAGQLDVSRRIERNLGIVLPECRIVFVLPDPAVMSTARIHPWAAIFLPLHIVISGNGVQTEILVQNRVRPGLDGDAPVFVGPVQDTQAQMAEAIETIAMRPSLVV